MSGMSLLLVEADPQTAGVIDLFLTARGHRVAVSPSASDARHHLCHATPDLVVVIDRPGLCDAAAIVPMLQALGGPECAVVALPAEGLSTQSLLATLRAVRRSRTPTLPPASAADSAADSASDSVAPAA